MTSYGYIVSTFRVRRRYKKGEPLELGAFDGYSDALHQIYGLLMGLTDTGFTETKSARHLKITSTNPIGRMIKFTAHVGNSGQTSQIFESDRDPSPIFDRRNHHIESSPRRGLILGAAQANGGLILLEVQGRSGMKTLLESALTKGFQHYHPEFILDVARISDEAALKKYLDAAALQHVILRRSSIPRDVADVYEFSPQVADSGKLELKITPTGTIRGIIDDLVRKFNTPQRNQMLEIGNIHFDDIKIAMQSGNRKVTMNITSESIPTFVYDLEHDSDPPTNEEFYTQTLDAIQEVSRALGLRLAPGWSEGDWSDDVLKLVLEQPTENGHGQG